MWTIATCPVVSYSTFLRYLLISCFMIPHPPSFTTDYTDWHRFHTKRLLFNRNNLHQSVQSVTKSSLSHCDALYLHKRSFRQSLNSYSRTGREISFEILGINSVHFSKQRHICQKYGCFYDISSSQTSFCQYILDILKTWIVCSVTPPGTNSPVAGSTGIWPDKNTIPFTSTAWL